MYNSSFLALLNLHANAERLTSLSQLLNQVQIAIRLPHLQLQPLHRRSVVLDKLLDVLVVGLFLVNQHSALEHTERVALYVQRQRYRA
jgi:hypothetical protein